RRGRPDRYRTKMAGGDLEYPITHPVADAHARRRALQARHRLLRAHLDREGAADVEDGLERVAALCGGPARSENLRPRRRRRHHRQAAVPEVVLWESLLVRAAGDDERGEGGDRPAERRGTYG